MLDAENEFAIPRHEPGTVAHVGGLNCLVAVGKAR